MPRLCLRSLPDIIFNRRNIVRHHHHQHGATIKLFACLLLRTLLLLVTKRCSPFYRHYFDKLNAINMVRPIVQHHPIMTMMSKYSIIGAISAVALGMMVSISMLVIVYLWLIALFYTFNTYMTLSAIEHGLLILVASIVKLLFDYMIISWFLKWLKWHDYKQEFDIFLVVGYLFGCLVWFILNVYTLKNPVLYGLQFNSPELEGWNTLWSVIYMVINVIIYVILVHKVQEFDIDQDNFAYSLMMV